MSQNNIYVGLKELRENMDKYIEQTARGKSFLVLRRSRPVFRLTPVDHEESWERVVDLTKIKKGGVSIDELLSRL